MNATLAAFKEAGLLPFANFNRIHVVPPCTVTEAEAAKVWPSWIALWISPTPTCETFRAADRNNCCSQTSNPLRTLAP